MPEKEVQFSHLARVNIPNEDRSQQLRSLLGERSDDEDLYVWDAEISNDLLDSHFTHMSESTLKNYAEDAARGVAFLRGHSWHELPLGYSLSGELGTEKGRKRVLSGFYTSRSIPEAADLIRRMEARILRDVSVGFHGGRMVCDLCGQDFWDCRHFPGLKYETKEGDVVKTELATFTIEDARLSEVSGVFDGSTPEAMIRKAQVHAAQGLLEPKQIEVLEQRYRTRLAVRTTHAVAATPLKETRKMERALDEKQFERAVSLLIGCGFVPEAERATADAETLLVWVDKLAARNMALEVQAKEGVQYRSDLVAQALSEGVRAHGNDFKTEEYKNILANAPLETIKSMGADWKKVADVSLPTGRKSEDITQHRTPAVVTTPDEAYA